MYVVAILPIAIALAFLGGYTTIVVAFWFEIRRTQRHLPPHTHSAYMGGTTTPRDCSAAPSGSDSSTRLGQCACGGFENYCASR